MFTVRTGLLADTSDQMQRMARSLNQQIDDVGIVVSRLRRISEFEEVWHVLQKKKEGMQEEKNSMLEMLASLNEIQRMYELSERNIMNYRAELHQINLRRMDVIDLSGIQKSIEVYNIR